MDSGAVRRGVEAAERGARFFDRGRDPLDVRDIAAADVIGLHVSGLEVERGDRVGALTQRGDTRATDPRSGTGDERATRAADGGHRRASASISPGT